MKQIYKDPFINILFNYKKYLYTFVVIEAILIIIYYITL